MAVCCIETKAQPNKKNHQEVERETKDPPTKERRERKKKTLRVIKTFFIKKLLPKHRTLHHQNSYLTLRHIITHHQSN